MAKLGLSKTSHFLNNGLTLAHLAMGAYDGQQASIDKTEFSQIDTFQHPQLEGFVSRAGAEVVVSFRGTDEPLDWVTNGKFALRKREPYQGTVHIGFAEALDEIWARVSSLVATMMTGGGERLWLTGHSLGGALATFAGVKFKANGQSVHHIATFGQPRCGDSTFAQKFRLDLKRFVNNNDIVATVPSRLVPGAFLPPKFYSHIGELCFFDENGKLKASGSNKVFGPVPDLTKFLGPLSNGETEASSLIRSGISDHKMSKYIACIRKNIP